MSEHSGRQQRVRPAETAIRHNDLEAAGPPQKSDRRPRDAKGERALAISTLEHSMFQEASVAQDFFGGALGGILELERAAALSEAVLSAGRPFYALPAATGVPAEEPDHEFVNRAALRYTELLGLVANEWSIPHGSASQSLPNRGPIGEQALAPQIEPRYTAEGSGETGSPGDWASVRTGLAFDLGRAVDLRWRAHLLSEAARDTPETTGVEAAAHRAVRELLPMIGNAILELHELLCRRAERLPLPEREEVRQEIHGEWMRWGDVVQASAPGAIPVSDEMRERLLKERDGMGCPLPLDVPGMSAAPDSAG